MNHYAELSKKVVGEKMIELRSCPFCGGKAVIKRTSGYDGQFYVRCANFNVCYVIPATETFRTKIEAINAWNRRDGEQYDTPH